MDQVLKLPALMALVQRSRSSIYADVRAGRFPAPIKLGRRSVGWLASDIQGWLAERQPATPPRTQR